eukprot:GHRR01011553.1.p1 GENE.GHRR01011553.1~~GHRR01011553.1.p1  ORF type:complete len:211 (+),score=49.86 GHRR01011553.1:680-1312(+)
MRTARVAGKKKLSRCQVVRMKVISMGETGVGKSCLIKRYCEEKFISKYIPTIGVDYGVKPVKFGDHEVRVSLWDLAGATDYLEVRNEFYKDSQAALLVYDVTNRLTFDALDSWLEECQKFGATKNMAVFVAASKVDIPGRKVTEKEGREWASTHNFPYFEVSAASGRGVKALFSGMFSAIINQLPQADSELVQYVAHEAVTARQAEGVQN